MVPTHPHAARRQVTPIVGITLLLVFVFIMSLVRILPPGVPHTADSILGRTPPEPAVRGPVSRVRDRRPQPAAVEQGAAPAISEKTVKELHSHPAAACCGASETVPDATCAQTLLNSLIAIMSDAATKAAGAMPTTSCARFQQRSDENKDQH